MPRLACPCSPCSAMQKKERPPWSSAQPCQRPSSDDGHLDCMLSACCFPPYVCCELAHLLPFPHHFQWRAEISLGPLSQTTPFTDPPRTQNPLRRVRNVFSGRGQLLCRRWVKGFHGLPPGSPWPTAPGPGCRELLSSPQIKRPHLPWAFPARLLSCATSPVHTTVFFLSAHVYRWKALPITQEGTIRARTVPCSWPRAPSTGQELLSVFMESPLSFLRERTGRMHQMNNRVPRFHHV